MDKVTPQPTSKAATILKRISTICFYTATGGWILFITFLLIAHGEPTNPRNAIWKLYLLFHAPLVGWVTYKAVADLKLGENHFFKKYQLVPLFVSFGITAPLSMLPLAIPEFISLILGKETGFAGFGSTWEALMVATTMGQLYWLLLLIQGAITIWGKKHFLLMLGKVIFYIATFICLVFVLFFPFLMFPPMAIILGAIVLRIIMGPSKKDPGKPSEEQNKIERPELSSQPTYWVESSFSLGFYALSLVWIIYVSSILVMGGNSGTDKVGGGLYLIFHATLVGFITYKAVIDLKLGESHFFKKYHLVPLFVSFGITAPLSMLPLVVPELMSPGGPPGWGQPLPNAIFFVGSLAVAAGQLYWLLIPMQVAITIFGEDKTLLKWGKYIFYASAFNVITAFILWGISLSLNYATCGWHHC